MTGVSMSRLMRLGRPCLNVTWTAPQSDATISRYRIQYKRTGTVFWGSESTAAGSPPPTFVILVALDVGTNYTVRVCATSPSGDGAWSTEDTERTFRCEFYASIYILIYCIGALCYIERLLLHYEKVIWSIGSMQ